MREVGKEVSFGMAYDSMLTCDYETDFMALIFDLSKAIFRQNWRSAMLIMDSLIQFSISLDYQLMISDSMKLINKQIYREFKHAKRVSLYVKWLSEACSFHDFGDTCECCGFIHDIGKLMIEPHILYKDGKLQTSEWDMIKNHVNNGVELLSYSNRFKDLIPVIQQHHELWDGTGYPIGLKQCQILRPARVLAIADAYDAMTSNRAYKDRLTSDQARNEINRCAGTQFDPEIAFIFTDQVLKKYNCSLFSDTFLRVD